MKKHEPLSSAKAIVGFLVLSIGAVLFWKFQENLDYLLDDPNALKGYVVAAIVGCGFLIVLMYLVGQTTHSKSSKKKK